MEACRTIWACPCPHIVYISGNPSPVVLRMHAPMFKCSQMLHTHIPLYKCVQALQAYISAQDKANHTSACSPPPPPPPQTQHTLTHKPCGHLTILLLAPKTVLQGTVQMQDRGRPSWWQMTQYDVTSHTSQVMCVTLILSYCAVSMRRANAKTTHIPILIKHLCKHPSHIK